MVAGSDLTVENIEFSGARVRDRNGAGIRPEGKNLTVRNCRFYDCENGILGGNGEMLFEGCEFEHCGPVGNPATHSLYIGERCTKLVFRHNYSTDVIEGHLLKSRAKESWLLYNRITDENGTGSAVADFPNGGVVVVIGNLLHKGARGAERPRDRLRDGGRQARAERTVRGQQHDGLRAPPRELLLRAAWRRAQRTSCRSFAIICASARCR